MAYPNVAGSGLGNAPPQEKLAEVLCQTNDGLNRAYILCMSLSERLVGPTPTSNDKAPPIPPGALAQAFEARSQAQRLVAELERIAGIL